MTEWREVRLGDLGNVVTGGTPAARNADWFGVETPFITPTDIGSTERRARVERWLSAAGRAGFRKKLLPTGTVCFVSIGATIGKLCLTDAEAVTNQQINSIVPNNDVDARFLYYLLRHQAPRIAQTAGGAATPIINKSTLSNVSVLVPDSGIQARIGLVLGILDDLIENNHRSVVVLEQMARAIYREWFVRFRFPGHANVELVDSNLGPIPEGWRRTELQRIAKVNATSRTLSPEEVIRYLDISALSEREITALASIPGTEAPGRARRVVRPGDIVWSMVRPNRRAHALLVSPGDDWIASTGLAVLTPVSVPSSYLFETVSAVEFSDFLVSRESGAAYPAVKPKDFEGAAVLLPDSQTLGEFDSAVGPMHRMAWDLREESASLAAMRDLLLPKLVTGQRDVSSLDLDALGDAAVAA